MTEHERLLDELRPAAYRMLAGVSEAEDIVQEALLRLALLAGDIRPGLRGRGRA
jgi:DNA-directed RNA polymerase specialized sigma24 family protein